MDRDLAQCPLEVLQPHRFREVTIEASLLGPVKVLRRRVSADRDQRDGPEQRIGAQGPRDFVAIHSGQPDIAQDHLWVDVAGSVEPIEPGIGNLHEVPVQLEGFPETFGCVDVVLDDENAANRFRCQVTRQRPESLGSPNAG